MHKKPAFVGRVKYKYTNPIFSGCIVAIGREFLGLADDLTYIGGYTNG